MTSGQSLRVRTLVAYGLLSAVATACGGGATQFSAKSPNALAWTDFKAALAKGAKARGCTIDDQRSSIMLTCTSPDVEVVNFSTQIEDEGDGKYAKSADLLWTCGDLGETACRKFVEGVLAAGK